ncbi:unnamed protein product [Prunus armeniaca]
MEFDRISNLPSDVVEQILSHLPIREAVRTSVLSSNWRYRSAMLPHLVFDYQCFSREKHVTFVNIVDHVLLGHIGPIHKFKLSHFGCLATWDIDRWILHLSRNSVKELILVIWEGGRYRVPSYLYSCQDIIRLELFRCLLKPPPTFKGFRNLKSLVIDHVTLAQDVFHNIIACCSLLEKLTLLGFSFTHLKIDAPNLQFLHVEGDFEDVTFEKTLNLADVCISMDNYVDQRWVCNSSSNLVKFLVQLPHIQRLKIQGFFLQILAIGALSAELPKPWLYLKFLSISINFNDPREILTALRLLRSSPAVQELEISADPSLPELGFSADQEVQVALSEMNSLYGNCICPFTQLRLVKISDFSDVKTEFDFIRFLLLNSPVLEKMIVKPAFADGSLELLKQLLRLGFRNLKSLLLKGVTLDQDVFQNLIACCPLLEKLTLSIPTFTHLKIDAPNLQFLDVEGDFEDVTFENTLNLADVRVCIYPHGRTWVWDNSNLVKFLVQLPLVQRLNIGRYFLQILVVGSLSPKLPKPCLYLKFLSIMVNFNDPAEVLTVLCLLRSSPAVQELEISVYPALVEEQDFYAHQEVQAALSEVNSLYGNWIFPVTQLRLVRISYIFDLKTELDFIRFLLLNSPVLEKMIVTPDDASDSLELIKQFLRLGRASVHSEIIFLDPDS